MTSASAPAVVAPGPAVDRRGRRGACRPPGCLDSFYPKFTAWRIQLRLSRGRLADLCALAGFAIEEELVVRIEARGQEPGKQFKAALAAVLGCDRAQIDHLFEQVVR